MPKNRPARNLPRKRLPDAQRQEYIRTLTQKESTPTIERNGGDYTNGTNYRPPDEDHLVPAEKAPCSPSWYESSKALAFVKWAGLLLAAAGVLVTAAYKYSELASEVRVLRDKHTELKTDTRNAILDTKTELEADLKQINERLDKLFISLNSK